MGGGNANKTAMSRARHLEKSAKEKNSGGGKAGKEARSGVNQQEAMAAAAAKRAEVKAKREAAGKK